MNMTDQLQTIILSTVLYTKTPFCQHYSHTHKQYTCTQLNYTLILWMGNIYETIIIIIIDWLLQSLDIIIQSI